MKEIISCVLLLFLVICAVAVSFSKKLLNSILIYMSYSLIMSILWILLESPDLGITEAAVGAGITSVLFFVTLKKIHAMSGGNDHIEEDESLNENGSDYAVTTQADIPDAVAGDKTCSLGGVK